MEERGLELYRRLVESVSDYAIYALDATGYVLSWNPGAQRIKGYTADEILGRHVSVFYPPEDVAEGKPTWELNVAAQEGRLECESWRVRKDGSRFWAHAMISVMRNDRGEVSGFAAVAQDLTERRRSEDAGRQSEERFRLIIQSVKDYAIFTLDPDGRVTSWNDGAERIKGYTADEILGQPFTVFYPADAVAAGFPQHELKMATRDGRFEDEGWRVRKDGSRFWANVIITALSDAEGRSVGFAKITRDLTARREAEAQARRLAAEAAALVEAARRSKELEAALSETKAARDAAEWAAAAAADAYRELDQFAYVASHDLKAPLRGIANLAQWIQEDLGEGLGAESRKHMTLLQRRVHRMGALIDGILAYSRAGRRLSDPERVDTGALVREAIELLAPPPEVMIEVPTDMPRLEAERVPLQQVFINLIGNAVKYTRATRTDVVVGVSWCDAGDAVEFTVSDNGPGIAPEYHERIWGMFQTLETRDKVEGTGIGLSVVKKIVEARGGRAWVESSPGQGAAFRFVWRKAVQHQARA